MERGARRRGKHRGYVFWFFWWRGVRTRGQGGDGLINQSKLRDRPAQKGGRGGGGGLPLPSPKPKNPDSARRQEHPRVEIGAQYWQQGVPIGPSRAAGRRIRPSCANATRRKTVRERESKNSLIACSQRGPRRPQKATRPGEATSVDGSRTRAPPARIKAHESAVERRRLPSFRASTLFWAAEARGQVP